MKNRWIWWIVAAIILFVLQWIWWYNGMIWLDENLDNKMAQVNNQYDRRKDLVPQVAAVVKKYAQYEWSVFTGIAAARSQSASLDILNTMIAKWDYKSEWFSSLLSSTLWGIRVSLEAYPLLKADTQFNNLYITLEWSENRIRTAIMDYNDEVATYNLKTRSFPRWIIFGRITWFVTKTRINPPADKNIKEVPNVDQLLQ